MIDLAIGRILLLHNMILAFGGIPLLYMGDEIGLLNDSTYLDDEDLTGDNRWMHRPAMDWYLAEHRVDVETVSGRIFQGLTRLVRARKRTASLHAQAPVFPVWTHNEQVFGLLRESPRGRLLALANFSRTEQAISPHRLMEMGFDGPLINQIVQARRRQALRLRGDHRSQRGDQYDGPNYAWRHMRPFGWRKKSKISEFGFRIA